jgi:hypothetical protein
MSVLLFRWAASNGEVRVSEMARSYYSTVLNHSAEEVWTIIRPFNHYAWAGVVGETTIEGGKAGDQIAAIRRVKMGTGSSVRFRSPIPTWNDPTPMRFAIHRPSLCETTSSASRRSSRATRRSSSGGPHSTVPPRNTIVGPVISRKRASRSGCPHSGGSWEPTPAHRQLENIRSAGGAAYGSSRSPAHRVHVGVEGPWRPCRPWGETTP